MRNYRNTIMIVEDSDVFRKMLNTFLHRDYHVLTAKNGLEGAAWLSKGHIPDLIVMDINMPQLDGPSFLKYLKNSGIFRSIPVILLSGSEEADEIASYLEAGASAYFLKPFNPVDLRNTIEDLLNKSNVLA